MHIKRRNKLIQTLNDHVHEKDKTENKSVILFKPENNFYLTNFWGEGITIISQNDLKTKLIVPETRIHQSKKHLKRMRCNFFRKRYKLDQHYDGSN